MDAALSKEVDETNLASSSLAETGDTNDLLGVIVSYSVKVTLALSGMGGELIVDLPFKLNHPKPGKGPFKYYVIKILTFFYPTHPVCNQTLL